MFITLEGIEGSGKTTQLRHIADFLRRKGQECIVTREPGGTRIGEKIRRILLAPDSSDMDSLTELLLYTADRVQHVKEILIPALSVGKTVLCDRYLDAMLVYQGYARGLDIELIERLHRLVLADLKPDITILLDLSPEEGLSRAWKQIDNGTRTGTETRFENEAVVFHEKVRTGYLALAQKEPDRFHIVDATQDRETVRKEILKALP